MQCAEAGAGRTVDVQGAQALAQPGGIAQLLDAEAGVALADRLDDRQAGEGTREIERAALVFEDLAAERLARALAQQPFGEVHQLPVLRVRLVELHHRELGVVARADALVAEVAVDLENPLQATDDQPLEIELGRDAQEEIHVERVVVRPERSRRRAAGNRVHHRRFHLEEAMLHHVAADRLHDAAAHGEGEARLFAGDQVDVAHAVLLFLVGEAVELLRQRPQRLCQQANRRAADGQFAGARAKQRADDADDVTHVPALERRVGLLADVVTADVGLDAAGEILQRDERRLAHHPLEHDAAGDAHLDRRLCQLLAALAVVELVDLAGGVLAREIVRVGLAELAQFRELGAAFGDDVVFVLRRDCGRVVLRLVELGHGVRLSRDQWNTVQVAAPALPARRGRPGGTAQTPCLRLASMNWSRSPSSTPCVLPTSTLVRRSLIRDWSRT
ncbi:MAG: hypothetical protein AW07_03392 [Candidatus Accumulibacter sp. SK-11]|nr:MAG: hypothetical protein AW07_03392 [Candidatus Accumulibacter sp. SK-11]